MTKEQESALAYAYGMLDGMAGSVHEDADHYRELAKFLVGQLRAAFPEVQAGPPPQVEQHDYSGAH